MSRARRNDQYLAVGVLLFAALMISTMLFSLIEGGFFDQVVIHSGR
jgi:hypothetical protein